MLIIHNVLVSNPVFKIPLIPEEKGKIRDRVKIDGLPIEIFMSKHCDKGRNYSLCANTTFVTMFSKAVCCGVTERVYMWETVNENTHSLNLTKIQICHKNRISLHGIQINMAES